MEKNCCFTWKNSTATRFVCSLLNSGVQLLSEHLCAWVWSCTQLQNSMTLWFLYKKETSIKLSLMLLEVLQILGSCLTFQSHRNLWDSRSRSHVSVRGTIWRQEGSETGRKKEMSGRLLHVWCERSEALLCCLILFSFLSPSLAVTWCHKLKQIFKCGLTHTCTHTHRSLSHLSLFPVAFVSRWDLLICLLSGWAETFSARSQIWRAAQTFESILLALISTTEHLHLVL